MDREVIRGVSGVNQVAEVWKRTVAYAAARPSPRMTGGRGSLAPGPCDGDVLSGGG